VSQSVASSHFATRLSAIAFLKTRALDRALDGSHVLQFTAKLLRSTAAERDIEGSAEDNHEPLRSFAQQALAD
jgi:hypothetical protein